MAERSIELRSEKARNIIGKVPPMLLRIGTMIITSVVVVILALMYYIPYPQTISLDVVTIKTNHGYIASGVIPIKNAKIIKVEQKVDILLYSLNGDYTVKGVVNNIVETNNGNARVEIRIDTANINTKLSITPSGSATIIISNSPILKRLMKL